MRLSLGAIALVVLAAAGSLASAQAGQKGLAPRLLNGDVPLLPDGVLIFEYDVSSSFFGEETIVVTDGSESVVPGSTEGPFVETGPIATDPPTIFWRAAQPFTPGKRYKVDTLDLPSGEARAFVIEIAADPIDRTIDPEWLTLELGAQAGDHGTHTACCENDDMPSRCFAPHLVLIPEVKVVVDTSSSSPYLRQLLFQTVSIDMMLSTSWAAHGYDLAPVRFDRQSDRYCVQIHVYDAITKSLGMLPEHCIDNQPELFEDTLPKDPENIAAALASSGCHRPPEGFEEAWCESNRNTCFNVGWAGCQHFDELCPDYPRAPSEPGSDTGVIDAQDAGADAGTKSSSGSSGCSCNVVAQRTSPPWPLSLPALLLLARLRRERSVKRAKIWYEFVLQSERARRKYRSNTLVLRGHFRGRKPL
jgi:MYXO-CTERM domain-containing protein